MISLKRLCIDFILDNNQEYQYENIPVELIDQIEKRRILRIKPAFDRVSDTTFINSLSAKKLTNSIYWFETMSRLIDDPEVDIFGIIDFDDIYYSAAMEVSRVDNLDHRTVKHSLFVIARFFVKLYISYSVNINREFHSYVDSFMRIFMRSLGNDSYYRIHMVNLIRKIKK